MSVSVCVGVGVCGMCVGVCVCVCGLCMHALMSNMHGRDKRNITCRVINNANHISLWSYLRSNQHFPQLDWTG